jgi:hypothetical protein
MLTDCIDSSTYQPSIPGRKKNDKKQSKNIIFRIFNIDYGERNFSRG